MVSDGRVPSGKTRMAKLPLRAGWYRTGKTCRWPRNVTSAIRKAELPIHNTKLHCIRKSGRYLPFCGFTFLHCTFYMQDHFQAVKIPAQIGEIASTVCKNSRARCSCNFNSGNVANGKTGMVPKTSKPPTAWWLASNWKNMPLATKCHINNQKIRASPNTAQSWIAFRKLVGTYNFAASLFSRLATSSPKVFLAQPPLMERSLLKYA